MSRSVLHSRGLVLNSYLSSSAAARQSAALRYGAAVITSAAALLISELLRPIVAPNPFIFFFASIAFSSSYGGLGPGLLATALAVLGVNYAFIPPIDTFSVDPLDLLRLLAFALVSVLVSSLSEARLRTAQAAQNELAQRERAEAQLRLIADALPVLISYLDRDQCYRFNNRAYEEWFGETRANVTGRHIRSVLGEAAYQTLQPKLEAALTGETVSFETLAPYRAGGARHIHATYVPDYGPDGTVRGMVVLVEDITARVRSQEGQRLLVAAGALLSSSLDYATTLAQVARLTVPALADYTIVYLADAGGQIVRSASVHRNPEQERLLAELDQRYSIDAHADIPLTEVLSTGRSVLRHEVGAELLTQLARDADHQRLIESLGTQAFMIVPIQAHGRIMGAMLCASTNAAHTYTPEDLRLAEELAYRAALAIDNAMLYQATSAARDLAEEAIRLRDLFFSVASHELKTPLTSLLLQIQLLQRRSQRNANLSDQDQRTLDIVASQAQRLDRMITSLLDVSRIELGQLSLTLAPVDLCALARRVVAEVQPTSEAHPIVCETPAVPLIVAGDELRLEQVLQNLLQNAIKYSPDGGQIEVVVAAQDRQISLTVADQGIGLPADALLKIFDRFYRASNADPRQISGMGVGLYVVKEIVRLHGGSVRAERRAGGGSSFIVCVPQAAGGASHAAPERDELALG